MRIEFDQQNEEQVADALTEVLRVAMKHRIDVGRNWDTGFYAVMNSSARSSGLQAPPPAAHESARRTVAVAAVER
jgi:hypothetical protein